MKEVKKGVKSPYNGVILTKKEYINYKNLLDVVNEIKRRKKEYMATYYGDIKQNI